MKSIRANPTNGAPEGDERIPPHGRLDMWESCPYCAMWIGAHTHWLREDGSLGLIVEPLNQSVATQGDKP